MIPDKVQKILAAHNLKALEFEAGSTPTAEAAARRIGVPVGAIAKSILLIGRDASRRMVILAGDRKLSNSKIKEAFGVKHSLATAEQTLAATGFNPGGVCPFGVEGLDIFVDASLNAYPTVYPAAGTDASGVPMRPAVLLELCGGRMCDVSEPK